MSRWLPWVTLVSLTGLLIVLFLRSAKYVYNAYLYAKFPLELGYGEGIVWQQAKLIPGPRMYGDLRHYPFLVFHYPPMFHLVANAVAWLGLPWLVAGRLVSILAYTSVALLVGLFVWRASARRQDPIQPTGDLLRYSRLTAALAAGLILLSFPTIEPWSVTARVDTLAAAFELLGMYLGLLALERPRLLPASAIVFVLAMYTKPTTLCGGVATFAVYLLYQPRHALRAALLAAVLALAVLIVMMAATSGRFLLHIVVYNINPFSLYKAIEWVKNSGPQITSPVYCLIALAMAVLLLVRVISEGPRGLPPGELIALLYFALTTLSLVELGKEGAAVNYFIPWICSVALLNGLAIEASARWFSVSITNRTLLAAIAASMLAQALCLPSFGERRLLDRALRQQYAELVDRVRAASKPVLSDDMVILMEANKEVPWEPAIITALSAKGMFDERKCVDLIESHAFAFVIQNPKLTDFLNSPAVRAAVQKAYPVRTSLAGYDIRLPAAN